MPLCPQYHPYEKDISLTAWNYSANVFLFRHIPQTFPLFFIFSHAQNIELKKKYFSVVQDKVFAVSLRAFLARKKPNMFNFLFHSPL